MCDSIVATPSQTADGRALYGKNSDRRGGECQPFVQFPAAFYPREARLRCVRATDENAALRAELGVARQRLGWPEVTDTEVRLVVDGKATDSLLCEKLLRTRLEGPSALASLLSKDD